MNITVPELSLVVLIGASSSGKSTFARQHFTPTEVVSSDTCRALVADNEDALDVNEEAFAILNAIASTRLRLGRIAVIDATNVQSRSRRSLVAIANDNDVEAVAIVFDLPAHVLRGRLRGRSDRRMGTHVIDNQSNQLRRSLPGLHQEGFGDVHVLRSPAEVADVVVERQRLPSDRREERGPFDIVGDIHGCDDELTQMLETLGYRTDGAARVHAGGRRAIFLGDLVNRGPASPAVVRTVMAMVRAGSALCVPGNHDVTLMQALQGREVPAGHGLAASLQQFESEPPELKPEVVAFVDSLPSHLVLDGGALVVAHAGMIERLQGRASGRVRRFALLGEAAGETDQTDELGLPARHRWARDYRGPATVVYGHTAGAEAVWLNRTICLDTGCVYGGKLTALRYPEMELVSVPARRTYYRPAQRPAVAGSPVPNV